MTFRQARLSEAGREVLRQHRCYLTGGLLGQPV
jgi:hypothetical protein